MTPKSFTSADSLHAAYRIAKARGFPAWWADQCLSAGLSDAFAVDRPWLEELGRRLEDAERAGGDDSRQAVLDWLAREAADGPYPDAAWFFLIQGVTFLLDASADNAEAPGQVADARSARAFRAALDVLRVAQTEACKLGQALNVREIDLQAVAEAAAIIVLSGEGFTAGDVLNAVKDHTAVVSLAEWLEAPTVH